MENLKKVLNSGMIGWNEDGMVTAFEKAFAVRTGSAYAVGRNSAMTALSQAVSISGAGTGTEVLVDPIVHFGGLAALSFNSVPRFVDVDPETYLMDPDSVEANITENTRALIVTNLWGLSASLDRIQEICRKNNIFMIEDCAHSLGSWWKGKHSGTFGDLGIFSFQQTKQLTTGDGGMMITDREDLHHKLYNEWAFGGESPAFMTLNFRMNELTAAVGLGQLDRVDAYLKDYKENLNILNEAVADCTWLSNRRVPAEAEQAGYVWCCKWIGDKEGLDFADFKRNCEEEGLSLRFGFTQQPAYHYDIFKVSTAYHQDRCPVRCPFYKSDYHYSPELCPNAEDLIWRMIDTPVMEIPREEIEKKAETLRRVIRKTGR